MDDKVGHTTESQLHAFVEVKVCCWFFFQYQVLDCFPLQGGWPFNIESMIVFNIECLLVLVDVLFNIKCLIVFLYKVDGHGQMQTTVLPHVSR